MNDLAQGLAHPKGTRRPPDANANAASFCETVYFLPANLALIWR